MLKTLSTLLAAGAFALMLAPSAQAFTPAPLGGIANADIIQVREGCGRGFHRWRGRCVRNVAPHRRVCRTVWSHGVRRTVCRTR